MVGVVYLVHLRLDAVAGSSEEVAGQEGDGGPWRGRGGAEKVCTNPALNI